MHRAPVPPEAVVTSPATPPADQRADRQAPPKPRRDPFFDNAKYLAIVLVVAGHAAEAVRDVPLVRGLYVWTYLFHMPLFIVVTGYLSRRFTFSGGKARKLITNLAVPYVIFETLYSLYFWAVSGGKPLEISLLRSSYLMWFLLALFLWRLSTPVWQQIRWPLAIAVGISLLSYLDDLPRELTMPRLLGLLPFYVLGLSLRPAHFALLRRPAARVAGAVTLVAALIGVFVAGSRFPMEWLFWREDNADMGYSQVTGTLVHGFMLLAGTVLVFAFLAVVPARRSWYSAFGATTLYSYLLHGFVIKVFEHFGGYDIAWLHTVPGGLTVIAVGAVLGTLLCTRPVVRVTHRLIEPKMTWAFTPLRRPVTTPPKG
jgi:fucose 4-O-acetylase-like acetyltransferase